MASSPTTDVRKLSLGACVMLVVLRISIGWQFFYEGQWKFQTLRSPTPWSAEGYLKNAQGPFREYFRSMVDDPYGLELLNQESVIKSWQQRLQLFRDHYQLDADQTKSLAELEKKAQKELADLFDRPEWKGVMNEQQKGTLDYKRMGEIELYQNMVARYKAKLNEVSVDFQQDHLTKIKAELDAKQKELTGEVLGVSNKFSDNAEKLLTLEQRGRGPAPLPTKKIDSVNRQTMWLLTISGLLLMFGLFSRVAAVAAAVFLLNVYLTIPPWPGVPQPAGPEHAFIVNKNSIELVACVALACMPTGRWAGLDALIHRFILRKKTD